MFIASSLPINYLSCQKCALSPFSCQPCHKAEMTGEQTAGEEQGKARSSARPQSSPPSDLGHYLLGTVSADYGSAEGGWAGAVSPRTGGRKGHRAGGRGKEKYTLSPQDGAFEFIALDVEKQRGSSISKGPAGARLTRGVGSLTLCSHLAFAKNTDHRGQLSPKLLTAEDSKDSEMPRAGEDLEYLLAHCNFQNSGKDTLSSKMKPQESMGNAETADELPWFSGHIYVHKPEIEPCPCLSPEKSLCYPLYLSLHPPLSLCFLPASCRQVCIKH